MKTRETVKSSSHPNIQTEFSGLLQYINQHHMLREALTSIQSPSCDREQLYHAIQAGKSDAVIFTDPNCCFYLLQLIQTKKIPFWQGMTVYSYLIALMQFTDKQSLKESDNHYKLIQPVEVQYLVENGKLTPLAEKYAQDVSRRFKAISYQFDSTQFSRFVLTLPKVEHWLVKLPYHANTGFVVHDKSSSPKKDYEHFIHAIAMNVPYFYIKDSSVYIPSSSVITYCLEGMSSRPIKMLPIFNTVGFQTLQRIHEQGMHPVACYNASVTNNLCDVHNGRPGPYIAWLHDIGHVFWANMLIPQERDFVMTRCIPQFESVKRMADAHNDRELVSYITGIIRNLHDFDLTYIGIYQDKATRLIKYVERMFCRSISKIEEQQDVTKLQLGDCIDDRLIFMLARLYWDNSNQSLDEPLWGKMLTILFFFSNRFKLNASVVDALLQLAAGSSRMIQERDKPKDDDIDWEAWRTLIESRDDSATIWQIAKDKHYKDLINLITHYKLKFFHPYMPMTSENRQAFKRFIESKINQKPCDIICDEEKSARGYQQLSNVKDYNDPPPSQHRIYQIVPKLIKQSEEKKALESARKNQIFYSVGQGIHLKQALVSCQNVWALRDNISIKEIAGSILTMETIPLFATEESAQEYRKLRQTGSQNSSRYFYSPVVFTVNLQEDIMSPSVKAEMTKNHERQIAYLEVPLSSVRVVSGRLHVPKLIQYPSVAFLPKKGGGYDLMQWSHEDALARLLRECAEMPSQEDVISLYDGDKLSKKYVAFLKGRGITETLKGEEDIWAMLSRETVFSQLLDCQSSVRKLLDFIQAWLRTLYTDLEVIEAYCVIKQCSVNTYFSEFLPDIKKLTELKMIMLAENENAIKDAKTSENWMTRPPSEGFSIQRIYTTYPMFTLFKKARQHDQHYQSQLRQQVQQVKESITKKIEGYDMRRSLGH